MYGMIGLVDGTGRINCITPVMNTQVNFSIYLNIQNINILYKYIHNYTSEVSSSVFLKLVSSTTEAIWKPQSSDIGSSDIISRNNEKRGNKQCLLDTPRRVTVNNKRLISKCKKSEKKYAYLQKPWNY